MSLLRKKHNKKLTYQNRVRKEEQSNIDEQQKIKREIVYKIRPAFYPIIVLLLLIVILGYFGAQLLKQQATISTQNKKIDNLQEQIDDRKDYNDDLRKQLEYTYTPDFMDKSIRDRFGWTKKNEIKFIDKTEQ